MELFGILFAGPVALVACAIYTSILEWVLKAWPRVRWFLLAPSLAVVGAQTLEVLLFGILGVKGSEGLLGLLFHPLHLAIFLLITPSLATVLMIWGRDSWFGKRRFVVPACALAAVAAVLLQYVVSEVLFGIDGHPVAESSLRLPR